jgi:hypothetical protein
MVRDAFDPVALPQWESDSSDPAGACLRAVQAWVGSEPLRELVRSFGGDTRARTGRGLLEYLDKFSAEHWDFRKGRERNLVAADSAAPSVQGLVKAAASALGLVATTQPRRSRYDTVLILGGLVQACLRRSEYAATLFSSGVRAREVVALGTCRRLAGNELEVADRYGVGTQLDEFAAMVQAVKLVFGSLGEPQVTESIGAGPNAESRVYTYDCGKAPRVRVIAAPSSEPDRRRADSKDTYEFWATQVPEIPAHASVLLITDSIYVPYQGCVGIETLGISHGFRVETVGTAGRSKLLKGDLQDFDWHNYLQEVRSAIRGMMSLHDRLESLLSAGAAPR